MTTGVWCKLKGGQLYTDDELEDVVRAGRCRSGGSMGSTYAASETISSPIRRKAVSFGGGAVITQRIGRMGKWREITCASKYYALLAISTQVLFVYMVNLFAEFLFALVIDSPLYLFRVRCFSIRFLLIASSGFRNVFCTILQYVEKLVLTFTFNRAVSGKTCRINAA